MLWKATGISHREALLPQHARLTWDRQEIITAIPPALEYEECLMKAEAMLQVLR